MANKGIIVDDAATGESLGCVDLRNNDDDSNPRIVQLTSDVTSPQSLQSLVSGTPTRILDFYQTGSKGVDDPGRGDGLDISSTGLVTNFTDAIVDISDFSVFVVYGLLYINSNGGTVDQPYGIKLTPLLFPDTGNEVAMPLPGAILRYPSDDGAEEVTAEVQYGGDSLAGDDLLYVAGNGTGGDTNKHPFLPLVYPTLGAKRVGIHARCPANTAAWIELYVYGLTGAAADSALLAVNFRDKLFSTSVVNLPYSRL